MKRSKAYRAAAEKVNLDQLYSPEEALALVASGASAKFDETVDVAIRLGVDPKKADRWFAVPSTFLTALARRHGSSSLLPVRRPRPPRGGRDEVGDDDLIAKVQGGYLDFDSVVATPDMMGKVGRLGRVLGPRGLMPNPKTGTVTMDVAKAVSDIKGGKIEFRTDRYANLHFLIGKVSFGSEKLAENYFAALDEILRLKPNAAKGRYLRKITVSSTMGPGVQIDPVAARDAD